MSRSSWLRRATASCASIHCGKPGAIADQKPGRSHAPSRRAGAGPGASAFVGCGIAGKLADLAFERIDIRLSRAAGLIETEGAAACSPEHSRFRTRGAGLGVVDHAGEHGVGLGVVRGLIRSTPRRGAAGSRPVLDAQGVGPVRPLGFQPAGRVRVTQGDRPGGDGLPRLGPLVTIRLDPSPRRSIKARRASGVETLRRDAAW